MLIINLLIAWRNIKKNKAYSIINVLGLAAGIASALLIWLWVQDELGFDRMHKNAGTLFRVETRWPWNPSDSSASTPYPLGPALESGLPGCAAVTRTGNPGILLIRAGKQSFYEQSLLAVDPAFLRMFTFPLEQGDPATALSRPLSVVISREMAEKYFPNQDPLGRILTVNKNYPLTVTGIMQNPAASSTLQPHFLVPADRMEDLRSTKKYWSNMNRWDLAAFTTWVQLRDPAKSTVAARKIEELFQRKSGFDPQPWTLEPLLSLRWQESRSRIYLFSGLALLVLLAACINFTNLATARAASRSKEIGLRKVIGAARKNLLAQFYGEAFLTTILAVLAAACLFSILLPVFQQISGKQLGLEAVLSWRFIPGFFAVIILTGLAAGSYPALFLSALQPVTTLKGQWRAGARAASFRRSLVVFQFTLSAVLLITTGVIFRQIAHMRAMNPGYGREHLIFLSLRTDAAQTYPVLKNELRGDPLVPGVTASFQLPMDNAMQESGTTWEGKDPSVPAYVYYDAVDFDYAETLGLQFAAGRPFSPEFGADQNGAFLVNERMVNLMNIPSPSDALGKPLTCWGKTGPIVGVLKDYHIHSARSAIEPQVISLGQDKLHYAVFRLPAGQIPAALNRIEAAWKKVNPGHPFEYRFFDDAFELMYRADERLGTMVKYFTFMSVAVSCLGLFGLASFTAAQRRKEIGVRKVLGASAQGIAILLGKDFLAWVAVANILAWPAAFALISNWLENFAYRPAFGWWLFPAAAGGSLALAAITVGYQTIRAALANPAGSLRYE